MMGGREELNRTPHGRLRSICIPPDRSQSCSVPSYGSSILTRSMGIVYL